MKYFGEKRSIRELAEEFGLNVGTVYNRIGQGAQNEEITAPPMNRKDQAKLAAEGRRLADRRYQETLRLEKLRKKPSIMKEFNGLLPMGCTIISKRPGKP